MSRSLSSCTRAEAEMLWFQWMCDSCSKAPALWRIPILCCALPSGTEWYSWLLVLVGVWTCTSPLLSLDTPLLTLLSPTDADPTVLVRCSYEFEFELTRELRDAPLCHMPLAL